MGLDVCYGNRKLSDTWVSNVDLAGMLGGVNENILKAGIVIKLGGHNLYPKSGLAICFQ